MFFKGTVTICWREIIPVVKLAHSEPGGVVRVDSFVCKCVQMCKVYYFNLVHASFPSSLLLSVFVSV